MSWESSQEYYRIINEEVHQRLGGVHSAKTLMLSVDFAEIEELQRLGNWSEATRQMVAAAQALERGGADFVVICTNTMCRLAWFFKNSEGLALFHPAGAGDVSQKSSHCLGHIGD